MNEQKSVKNVTTICKLGRVFYIVYKDGHYCAIENTMLDEHGCLKQRLNGLQMMASEDLKTCIDSVLFKIDFDNMIESGFEASDALRVLTSNY